tara:strand:+ start:49 stop:315 length:267 start_codon:yes stop_codon:yes gene_type:complete
MGWKYDDKQAEKMFLLREREGLAYRTIGQRFGTDPGHARTIVARYRRSLPSGASIHYRPVAGQPDTNKGRLSTSTSTKGEKQKTRGGK